MKKEIINIALKNLRRTTGVEGQWQHNATFDNTLKADGILKLKIQEQEYSFNVIVHNEVRNHQVHQLELYQRNCDNFLLIAKHIFPKVKEELHQKKIAYLEANGNIFLKTKKMYLFVDTQKAIDTEKGQSNRAFTKTGLKVLFYLLQNRENINLTQREIAKDTEVALGNIPLIIKGLQESGYLIPLNKREYVWKNRRDLLDRWIKEYGTTLKPTIRKGQYTHQGDWKKIKLNNQLTVWGGEPAADMTTNYLRAETLTLYTQENRMNLIKNYKLTPNPNGDIEALEMFWKQNKNQQTVPAILIYADLILEGSKRNRETAEIIFNEQIRPNL